MADEQTGFDALRAADFRFLIERNADGVLVVDEGGDVLFANPAAEAAFGRSASELVGVDIGVPLVAGETTEISILRPAGGHVDAEMRVVSTSWRNRPALLVSLRDVSARKAVEERMRQAQKMESIGRLTAGIAHDFNNLLTVIMGNLGIVQRELDRTNAGARLSRGVDHAMEGAKRAAALTQRLLSFARRQPLEPRPIDVNKLVVAMSDLLHRTLGEAIEVQTAPSSEPLHALADPNQLEAAILNLAANARDAMPGGGRLLIETRLRRLDGTPELAAGDYVEIKVIDTGEGMSPEIAAKAFEPFFSTKDVGQGTGLGLSQVFGFVRQSAGDVTLESRPGAGTSVTLHLPSVQVPVGPTEERPAESDAPAGETILVVDDEDDVRSYSVGVLRELGYRVLEAVDAQAALGVLAAHLDIRLLFTDIGLPGGMNGEQLSEEARRLRPGLPVLFTTAYAGETLLRGGRLEPGVQLLPKPFTYGALAAKVRAVIHADSRPPRVLVVEDEPLVRMTIVEALIEAGCRIEEAASASEAVSKFRDLGGEIDVAIIDIGLPDGRGDGLIGEFRSFRPDLAVLLSTGYDESVARTELMADQRIRLLEKPFDGPRLKAALGEVGVVIGR